MMKAIEFVNKCIDAAKNYKTLYIMGCFGAPMNSANKKRYTSNHSYNKAADRTAMINAASADTFGFDCVCFIKGILWGWCGDASRTYGGASYTSNGVPDIGANEMIKRCYDVTTDFSDIVPGECVWMDGHVGVYVGNGLAVECSPKWENKVQITACNTTVDGYNRRNWTKHGKLPYIEYEEKPEELHLLDEVRIKEGVTTYYNGVGMAAWVPKSTLYVRNIDGDKVTVSTLKEGAVTGTVWRSDIERLNIPSEPSVVHEANLSPVEEPVKPSITCPCCGARFELV